MKILFVSELYPTKEKPQYCIFIEQQAQALQNLGNEVDVLRIDRTTTEEQSIKTEGVCNGLRIFSWKYGTSKMDELLITPLKNETVKSFLLKENYDIVSLHMGSMRAFKAIVHACQSMDTKVFAHYHGLNVWKDYIQSTKQSVSRAYRNLHRMEMLISVDGVVGVSDCVCQEVRRHYTGPIFTVYNGVDLERFAKAKKMETGFIRILCVANLIPLKGQSYLIRAVSKVIKNGHQVELILVGEGPERKRLQDMCTELGIAASVRFLGTQSYDEVAKQMRLSDIFIMPSHFEAFGCVYVEAMATGILTCGCNLYGAAEIIDDRKNGLLFEQKNVDAIVDVILFAISNPEEAQKIAENGRRKSELFSWKKSAECLVRAYQSVMP